MTNKTAYVPKVYKMEKFVEFEVWDYMDYYPRKKIQTFRGDTLEDIEKNAREWAEWMSNNYSGGTTEFIKIMSQSEALDYITSLIAEEEKNPFEDSETFITNITDLYNKCYVYIN